MNKVLVILALLLGGTQIGGAQEISNARQFWNNLKQHDGNAYEGRLADGMDHPDFDGKRLVMHVRACEGDTIRIPFVVGEDLSRTWVLIYHADRDRITLKHDHRHADGSEDEVTQYGGTSTNEGFAHLQFFPADSETAERIDYASANVWWITLDDDQYTYNLRRLGTERLVTVIFDLKNPVEPPPAPWGWTP